MSSGYDHRVGEASRLLSDLRAGLRTQLAAWELDELADEAVLVITELVANARTHGQPPVTAALTLRTLRNARRCIRIEVFDTGPAIDLNAVRARWRHPSFDLTETGLGLAFVDAVCRAWGDRPSARGHTVWAELPLPH